MGLFDKLRHRNRAQKKETIPAPPSTPEPPPSPTLSEPWRNISWGDKETDLKYVKAYQPKKEGVNHLRVLLYGPVGAGKSSFINSVSSVMRGRIVIPAAASAATSEISFTTKYQTHTIEKDGSPGEVYPFVLTDVMGLEDGDGRGVRPDDIKLAMMGHVMEKYQFSPASSLSDDCLGYNKTPSADNRCHILVCVISANLSEIKESVSQKMKIMREAARDMGIPQVCILTHIDEACENTDSDVKNVYKSKHIKKKMRELSSSVGFPMNCIFPVKNYSDEKDLNDDVDTLILSALKVIINHGDDYIKKL